MFLFLASGGWSQGECLEGVFDKDKDEVILEKFSLLFFPFPLSLASAFLLLIAASLFLSLFP